MKSFRTFLSLFLAIGTAVWCFHTNIWSAKAVCPPGVATWTGAAFPDPNWSNPANWDVCGGPTPGGNLVFGPGVVSKISNNDLPPIPGLSLIFYDGGYDITSNPGNPIIVGANPITTQPGVGANSIDADMLLTAPAIINVTDAASTLTFGGQMNLNSNNVVFLVNGIFDVQGNITGIGDITKNGTGFLNFDNNDTYNGTTTINVGSLDVVTSSGLGTPDGTPATEVTVNAGGQLKLENGVDVTNQLLVLSGDGPNSDGALKGNNGQSTWEDDVALNANTTFSSTTGSEIIMNGTISGSYNLTKVGVGTLTLKHDNTYSGQTIVNGGMVSAQTAGALGAGGNDPGSGTIVDDNATLQLAGSGFTVTGETLTLNGTGVSNAGAFAATSAGSDTYQWNGPVTLADDSTFKVSGASATLFVAGNINNINGTRGLHKDGPGILKLAGQETYNGGTYIIGGTLQVAAGPNYVLPHDKLVTVGTGATLDLSLSGGGETIGSLEGAGGSTVNLDTSTLTTGGDNTDTNFSGALTGSGELDKVGTGTMMLSGPSPSYSGNIQIKAGAVNLANSSAAGTGTVYVTPAGSLKLQGGITVSNALFVSTTGNPAIENVSGTNVIAAAGPSINLQSNFPVAVDAGTLAINKAIIQTSGTDILSKTGAGALSLGSAASTYTGATNISAGQLQIGVNNGIPAASAVTVGTGATLDLSDYNETIASLSGAGNVNMAGSNVLTVGDSTSTSFSGLFTGTGGVTKTGTGTLTLSGNSTYTGATTLNGGSLVVNGSQPGSAITVNAGTTLKGSGTTGNVTVTGGTVSPGNSPGVLHTGSISFNSASTYVAEINGPQDGVDYDQLIVTGTATLGDAQLNLTAVSGLPIQKTFSLIQTTSGLSGTFHQHPDGGQFNLAGSTFQNYYYPKNYNVLIPASPPAPVVVNQGPGGSAPPPSQLSGSSSGSAGSSGTPATSSPSAPTGNQPTTTTTPPTGQQNNSSLHGAAPQNNSNPSASPQNVTALTNFFKDTANHWAQQEIDEILNKCKVAGYKDIDGNLLREFRPDNNLSRAELMTMLIKCKVGPLPQPSAAPFPDVPADHWGAPYIAKGVELGLISGYSDGTFKPNQTISRSEALKIILLSWFTLNDVNDASTNSTCTDISDSAWYAKYFYFALNRGFLGGANGSGTVLCRPDSMMTRAESASTIVKVRRAPVAFSPDNLALKVSVVPAGVSRFAGVQHVQFAGGDGTQGVSRSLQFKLPHKVKRQV